MYIQENSNYNTSLTGRTQTHSVLSIQSGRQNTSIEASPLLASISVTILLSLHKNSHFILLFFFCILFFSFFFFKEKSIMSIWSLSRNPLNTSFLVEGRGQGFPLLRTPAAQSEGKRSCKRKRSLMCGRTSSFWHKINMMSMQGEGGGVEPSPVNPHD